MSARYPAIQKSNSLEGELKLSDKKNSDQDDKCLPDVLDANGHIDVERFLEASSQVLLVAFPNPTRVGCPGEEILRGLADHKLTLSEVEAWSKHLSACSECYADYLRFRNTDDRYGSLTDDGARSRA